MNELQTILDKIDRAENQQSLGIATVIKVEGSSYRRVGAMMLFEGNGKWSGGISGGCLEGDALKRLQEVIKTGVSTIHRYDTSDDDEASIGAALGCNGVIHVLLEKLETEDPFFKNVQKCLLARKEIVVSFVYDLPKQKLYDKIIYDGKHFVSQKEPNDISPSVQQHFEQQSNGLSSTVINGTALEVSHRFLSPPIQLFIFGAGNDTIPVVQMAEVLGWETMIAYNCHAQLLPLRFPKSASLKFVSPKSFAQECLYDQRTAIILMSHSYQNDLDAFKSILKTGKTPSYLGVLGPKKRTYKMLNELGIPYPEYLKAPVGLEIGAEGPEEIALSIVSEIKAVLSNSPATPLSQKSSPIHDRSEQVIKEEIFLDIV